MKRCLLLFSVLSFFNFAHSQVPTISSFSPASGPVGSSITITGTGFSATASANIVYMGGIKATVTAATTTTLSVTVPGGMNSQPITVTTNNRTAAATRLFKVTFGGGGSFNDYSFGTPSVFSSSTSTQTPYSADLNGDGKPEIVVPVPYPGSISVYKNTSTNKNISYAPNQDFNTKILTYDVAVADFDGDGKLDIAAPGLSVFRNTSTSNSLSFATRQDFITANAVSIQAKDMDLNGLPDIIWAASNGGVSIIANTSSVGNLSFASASGFANSYTNYTIADFDGDGKLDIAGINQASNQLSVVRNLSTGSGSFAFAAPVTYTIDSSPFNINATDLDTDGKADIVISYINGDGVFSLLKNNSTSGTINFAAKADLPATVNTSYLSGISFEDLDGDGLSDLLLGTYSKISAYRNTTVSGALSFDARKDLTTSYSYINSGDLDGDGKPRSLLYFQFWA